MEGMRGTNKRGTLRLAVLLGSLCIAIAVALSGPTLVSLAAPLAQTAPTLGAVGSYSVLAGTTVTNSGLTTMPGDLGVSPGLAIVGFTGPPDGTVGPPGTIRTTADAAFAQLATDTARLTLEGQGPGTTVLNELAGQTLGPGVYTVPGVSLLSGGVLTLDGAGVYIFLTDGLTASGTVSLINGADPCNVFWRDASSVGITGGSFVGTIISLTSISMGTGATLEGRALAQNGAVTLLANTFTGAACLTSPVAAPTAVPAVAALPDTGGAPIQDGSFPWSLVIIGGASAAALAVGVQAYRRTRLPKQ